MAAPRRASQRAMPPRIKPRASRSRSRTTNVDPESGRTADGTCTVIAYPASRSFATRPCIEAKGRHSTVIDVRFVIAHGLWILGAAVILAAFSYYDWWAR